MTIISGSKAFEIEGSIKDLIDSKKTFLITSHIRGDGDSIGSQLALYRYLMHHGRTCRIINSTAPPTCFSYLPNFDKIEVAPRVTDQFDVTFTLDIPEIERTGFVDLDMSKLGKIVNIDHHLSNSGFAHIRFWDPERSSACELLYELLVSWKDDLCKEIGLCIFTGIMTDSGNLTYRSTTGRTYQIAADIISSGVDHYKLRQKAYRANSRKRLRLLGHMLSNFSVSPDNRIAWYVIDNKSHQEMNTVASECYGFIGHLMSLEELDLAIVFVQDKDETILEFRSSDYIDSSSIATHFGGGGHRNASGACIKGDASKIASKVLKYVLENIEKYEVLKQSDESKKFKKSSVHKDVTKAISSQQGRKFMKVG